MSLRFFNEHKSWSDDLTWRVEIHDSAFSGDEIEFAVENGAKVNWRADGDSILSPMLASSLTFSMVVQDADHEDLLTDIAGAVEGRFTVVLFREGVFFWAGVMNSPELSIGDMAHPYAVQLSAVDGLALLKNYEYRQEIDSATKWFVKYEGQSRIVAIIARCLQKLPHVTTHFVDNDPFIVTAVNFYSDFQADAALSANDPLWEHFIDNRAFVEGQTSGNAKFLSCYDVISTILYLFNARIGLFDGLFLVEQIEHRVFTVNTNENFARSYDWALTAPTAHVLPQSQAVGGAEDVKKLRGGTYSFLPALKSARVTQTVNGLQNLVSGALFNSADNQTYLVGDVYGDGLGTYVRFTANIEWTLTNHSMGLYTDLVGIFDITILIDGKYATRTVTLVNPDTYEYSAITWSGSAATLKMAVKMERAETGEEWTGIAPVDLLFRTDSTFDYGDMQVSVGFDELAYFLLFTQGTVPGAEYSLDWAFKDAYCAVQKSRTAFAPKSVTYEVRGGEDNTQVQGIKTIVGDRVGDIMNQWGGFLFFDDPDYVYTELWGTRNGARDKPIAQLLAQRLVLAQYFPRKTLRATLVGSGISASTPLLLGGDIYILKNGTYDTERDEMPGEWVHIEYTSAELDYLDPEYDTGNYEPNSPGGGGSGGGGGVDNGGGGVTPGGGDGNGIYSGNGTVKDGTVATLEDDFFIEGGDGSSLSITTGATGGGRVLSNFNGSSISFLDSGGENTVAVGTGGVVVTLNGSVGDFMQVNGLAKYAADYSADYDDRTLVDKEYVDNNSGTGDINNGGNTTGGAITIGTNDNFALNFETNNITRQSIATDGAHTISANHTATTSVKNALTIQVNNDSGAGGNGYGGAILFQGESSTTVNRDMVKITGEWQVATDASRLARCRIYGIGAGQVLVEMVRFDNNIGPNMVIGGTGMVYSSNSITTSSGDISLTNSAATGNINLTVSGSTVGNTINVGGLTSFSQTTGNKSVTTFANSFSVASGSATFYNIRISPTINQTGSASGATGAIIFAPNLTSIGSKWSALTSATSNANALFINQTGANSYSTHVGAFGFGAATVPTDKLEVTGNVALLAAGNKIKIATGSNASVGTATLVGGTVTVNTTAVATGSTIFLTCNTPGGTQGFLSAPSASITNATSFVINSSSGADTSTVNWWIIN